MDPDTCRSLIDRYTQDKDLTENQLLQQDASIPDMKVRIAFASKTLTDVPRVWNHVPAQKRAGFAKAMYPDGRQYTHGVFGATTTPWHIRVLGTSEPTEEKMVPPTLADWNRVEQWLWDIDQLRQIVAITDARSPFGVAGRGDAPVLQLRHEIGTGD